MTELNRQQLCAALGISESQVRRLEQRGLPCTPVGARAKRYNLDECREWLRNNPCQSGQTSKGVGMSASWSGVREFIESSRKMRLRVTPSESNLKYENP